jgi:hypothetical protein
MSGNSVHRMNLNDGGKMSATRCTYRPMHLTNNFFTALFDSMNRLLAGQQ